MSPTARSLAELRKRGYTVEIVERFNFYTKTRHDLFNMFDLLAIHPQVPGCLGIQTTSNSNTSTRIKKLQANPILDTWIRAGNEAVVHGWSKKGKRGQRKLWTLTETPVVP